MKRAVILDGYVDEPACFGVPPYISPYIRYLAGVLFERDFSVSYFTCDQWRQEPMPEVVAHADLTVVIAGMTVPGRYRGGTPLSLTEMKELASLPRKGHFFLGGPILAGYTLQGGVKALELDVPGVDLYLAGDPEMALAHYLDTGEFKPGLRRDYKRLDTWAELGASVVRQHPWFPWVMAEVELSRGCDRMGGHCSFCSEGRSQLYEERPVEGAISEVRSLYRSGVRAFRFGRCANILAYGGREVGGRKQPEPKVLEELYRGIRQSCPDIRVLHTDNANPLTIAHFPDRSAEAIEIIALWNTPGDVLSLGLENLDPLVRDKNCLKVGPEEAYLAVRIINEAGNVRKAPREMPAVLPGLNFLFGLAGDSRTSLEINRDFLLRLLSEDLAVRRINIRRAIVLPGAPLERLLENFPSRLRDKDYRKWKRWVREEVDPEMIRRVAPTGTIIRNVKIEEKTGKINFGRPLGSYPPLIGIPSEKHDVGETLDIAVTSHGGRSLTGVPFPLRSEDLSMETLLALPGIGKARARRLLDRDHSSPKELLLALDDPEIGEGLLPFLEDPAGAE